MKVPSKGNPELLKEKEKVQFFFHNSLKPAMGQNVALRGFFSARNSAFLTSTILCHSTSCSSKSSAIIKCGVCSNNESDFDL